MLKVATALPNEPYREYKDVERVYSGSTEIDKILDKNGNVLFAVNKEVEGTPALTYKGKEETNLKNYRIYGQTSRNLFDGFSIHGKVPSVSNGELVNSSSAGSTTDLITIDTGDITLSKDVAAASNMYIFLYSQDKTYIGCTQTSSASTLTLKGSNINGYQNAKYVRIRVDAETAYSQVNIMLNTGSTPLPYEPYGESVGDRTGNLFDMKKFAETAYPNYATVNYSENSLKFTPTRVDAYVNEVYSRGNIPDAFRASCINVQPLTTYTISMNVPYKCYISWSDDSFNLVDSYTEIPENQASYTFTTPSNCTKLLFRLGKYVTNIGDTFTISDIMLNAGSTPLPYEPYGYKVPVTVEGKNLLQSTATSQTINGVTFTVNDDGSITCNGTAEQTIFLSINNYIRIEGNVILSGCPDGGGSDSYMLRINSSGTITTRDQGSGANAINPLGMVEIRIASGYTCNNVTFYPMIRRADIEDDTYEPYHAPVITPIYLPEPIKMVGNEAEYVDYKEQKLHRVRKNLWPGVVEQGAVSTIGDYPNALNRIRSKNISLSPGTYTISCDLGIRCVYAYNNSEKVSCIVDNGGGIIYRNTFTVPSGANNVSVGLRAFDASGAEMDTVKPSDFKWGQIEKGSEATTYEPYIENTELDVTLPALPTLSGTNTLTVGTEVQPSNVYLKGRIKEIA